MNRTQKTILAVAMAVTISIPGGLLVGVPEMGEGQNVDVRKMSCPEETISSQVQVAQQREGVAENNQIIAELYQSVDALEKSVDEALKRAKDRMRTVRIIPVTVTAYNPISAQTDSTPEITASNKRVREGMVALSRDVEEEFGFQFGDIVVIKGLGSFVFEDRMNRRWRRRVDILLPSLEAARKFGVRNSSLLVSN